MNDWNYTKKIGKLGLIYGLIILIIAQSSYFLAPYPESATDETVYELKDDIYTLTLLMSLPLFIPLSFLEPFFILLNSDFWSLIIPLSSVFMGAAFGFLIDFFCFLINYNKIKREGDSIKNQKEKDVFIRIPLSTSRKIVISEKFVNCFIVAIIILLGFMVSLQNFGVMDRIVVDGGYRSYDYKDNSAISFNSELYTFSEKKSGKTKTGTYTINETVLILYYSDGNTTEFSIYELGIYLYPLNKSQFSSDEEWKKNGYVKPILA